MDGNWLRGTSSRTISKVCARDEKWTEEEVSKMGFDGFRVEYKGFLEEQPLYIYAWWSAAGQK